MTLVPKIATLALAAPKPHGPWGKDHAQAGDEHPPATTIGALGLKSKPQAHVDLAALFPKKGAAGIIDPLRRAVLYSRTNLQFHHLSQKQLNKEVSQLFKDLGYAQRAGDDRRKKMNSVLRRLSVPIPTGGLHEPDLLHEIIFNADRNQLDPRFLAAALFTEAHWPSSLPKHPDNFDFIGMDRFELELDDMITEHLLTKDFKKGHFKRTGQTRTGEKGAVYKQIRFNDVSTTIEAFAAFIKHRRNFLVQDLKELGYENRSADELDYWNYVYYNAGGKRTAYSAPDGTAEKAKDSLAAGYQHLKHETDRVKKGQNPGGSLIPVRVFPDVNGNFDSRDVAQRMLLIKKLLQDAGMADPADPNTMKFQAIDDMAKIVEKLTKKKNKAGSLLDL